MARPIMIQGTMSNAGKSLVAAGLCRVFKQDGYRVAPFKSQNMALNSYITEDGLEMGRAQAVQAEACGIEPSVDMNPILLKPTTDMGSQVIVHGEVVGNMAAATYFKRKKEYIPAIMEAYKRLDSEYDIIVIEGAGSPAEINLKQDDIVNMGMASLVDAPVLLVGDIDRGGVFAQLIGTVMLLTEDEQDRIKGLLINKFRGDKSILEPGLKMLEDRCGKKVIGVVPYADVDIEDEDSLAERLADKNVNESCEALAKVDIAVIKLPRISNFTDFQALSLESRVSLRYVDKASALGTPDVIILPGTKNTISDLKWLRESGLEAKLVRLSKKGTLVVGICGGYQMLGEKITDAIGAEGSMNTIRGLGLLPVETYFEGEKERSRIRGTVNTLSGELAELSGCEVEGYEIHMGQTVVNNDSKLLIEKEDCHASIDGGINNTAIKTGNACNNRLLELDGKLDGYAYGNVFGTYLHGIFDNEYFRNAFVGICCKRKGIEIGDSCSISYQDYKQMQLDRLADVIRENVDIDGIYHIMGL